MDKKEIVDATHEDIPLKSKLRVATVRLENHTPRVEHKSEGRKNSPSRSGRRNFPHESHQETWSEWMIRAFQALGATSRGGRDWAIPQES